MSERDHYLHGADDVRSAANTMRSAADAMSSAANLMSEAAARIIAADYERATHMNQWLEQFEKVVQRCAK